MAKEPTKSPKRTFHQDLILNQWLLSLFNQQNIEQFKLRLGDDRFEGIDETGQTFFFQELCSQLFHTDLISEQDLRRYDLNIVKHWQKITEQRNKQEGHILNMKYFQYLSLLFTEIYLDYYFNRREVLLRELNRQRLIHCNNDEFAPEFTAYDFDSLNKLAFWNATGSGKTLLMHVNILQFRYYSPNKNLPIYVLTPNEGLSKQHLNEFFLGGFNAGIFNKSIRSFDDIQILEFSKLAEVDSVLKVAVSSFEGDKLVLIDEGHRGTTGSEWLNLREKMIDSGFAFEYSATFGQAVSGGLKFDKKANRFKVANPVYETYAKSVLFDYSYPFFYKDGYGKEHRILNLKEFNPINEQKYFIACLLAFYQQLYLFQQGGERLKAFNIEKPLWVFVGNTVNSTSKNKDVEEERSDILQVLHHLAFFVNPDNQPLILTCLEELLADTPILLDDKGNSIFHRQFLPLADFKGQVQSLFENILKSVFNADSNQRLRLVNLKRAEGEMGLQLGNSPYFGVINIGDTATFMKNADNDLAFDTQMDEFEAGLFGNINQKDSQINLLIGSRKFTEGWSSWRVSTMGLLNMGKSEGSQIIQLFGRGVRLKGKNFSLRRTQSDPQAKGLFLDKLETLNIFGIKANYMAEFKKYLADEGMTTSDELITLDFPTKKSVPTNINLKTLRLKEGYQANQINGFKRQQVLDLYDVPEKWQGKIKPISVKLDLYPRVEALVSTGVAKSLVEQREEHKLNTALFELFDWDNLYLALRHYKTENYLFNFQLNKIKLKNFVLQNQDWYQLYIPASELALTDFSAVQKQQHILLELLKLYTDRFYQAIKRAYEAEHFVAVPFTDADSSFVDHYVFSIEPTDEGEIIKQKLIALKEIVEKSTSVAEFNQYPVHNALITLSFDQHLYNPLFVLKKEFGELPLTLTPLSINEESEIQFVQDLIRAEKSGELYQWIGAKKLFLMRNSDKKSKGLGFALAGNFYPDFLLWLIDNKTSKQWLTFVDPKGIRNMDLSDPKFGLPQVLKELEAKNIEANLVLNSFVLSITKQESVLNIQDDAVFTEKQIIFMQDKNYLQQLFEGILQ